MKLLAVRSDEKPPSSMEKNSTNNTEDSESQPSSLFKKTKNKFFRALGLKSASLEEGVAELIEEHDPEGTQVSKEERNVLNNVLSLNELTASDVMVPRSDIVGVGHNISLSQLKEEIIKSEHTRLPVYKKTLDNIVGFIHIKDLVPLIGCVDIFQIDKIMREILYVAPSMKVMKLLAKMRKKRVHMAIVIDEYGGTQGLVTMEDIMEEIVGEIEDEHDEVEKDEIVQINETTYDINARTTIKEIEEKINIKLKDEEEGEDYDTIGGLIFYILGRIPKKQEKVKYKDDVEFEITQVDPRRIKRVRMFLNLSDE